MLTSTNKKDNNSLEGTAKVRVIKNGHTAEELAEAGERWATHTGPYMTLAEVLAAEAAKQNPWRASGFAGRSRPLPIGAS